jgi:hypothetical protein
MSRVRAVALKLMPVPPGAAATKKGLVGFATKPFI